jgi:hypothetical protein
MTLDRTWYNALVDDAGTGTTGTVWNKAQINNFIASIDSEIPNTLTNVPFNAANFVVTSGAGTWTVASGNVPIFQYVLVGHLCYVGLYLTGSTITGAPTQLQIQNLPFTPGLSTHYPVWVASPTWKVIDLLINGGTASFVFQIDPAASTAFGAGTLNIFLSIVVYV